MTARTYNDSDILAFYEEYKNTENWPLVKFAQKNNLKIYGLRNGFKRLDLKVFSQEITKRKYRINDNFFQDIDTEEKAYFLGFIFADGCNCKRRLEVSLAKQDIDILEKLSKTLLFGVNNIKEYKTKKEGCQDKIGLYIVSEKLTDDLKRWGCVPCKTFVLNFPKVPKHLINHFVRGYFDGDGSLTFGERKKTKYCDVYFSIVSTYQMLTAIGSNINLLGVNWYINKRHKERKNNNYTLRVHGKKQIRKVCDWLYSNATIFLNRKFEAYQRLVNL